MIYKTTTFWPKNTGIELGNSDNSSTDIHGSFETAEGVRELLLKYGCGGDCRIFPLSVHIDVVEEKPSEPHQIVAKGQETYSPVTNSTLRCPRCLSSWDGGAIPEDVRQHYSPPYRWSKLIGVEIPGVYDGVHHWVCPSCKTTFPRWIEDAAGKPVSRMFKDEMHLDMAPVFR